jgi:hypothetical protein
MTLEGAMAFKIRRADYFYTAVQNQPGEGYKLLSELANLPTTTGTSPPLRRRPGYSSTARIRRYS